LLGFRAAGGAPVAGSQVKRTHIDEAALAGF